MASNITRDHHNLRRNLKLNGNYISNDGDDEGISISNLSGIVSISNTLDIKDNMTITEQEIDVSTGDLTLDVAGDIYLNADGDQISMGFGANYGQIDFSSENSGDGIIRQMVDAKDLIIQQYDGNEVARFADDVPLASVYSFSSDKSSSDPPP